jgi:lipoprotein NlpD
MGNLLLVSHTGGYITAYGYNDELLVKKGDTVKKGQAIAKVGTSGGSKEPALHFEVRQGNKPVDPATVLPPQ